MTMQKWTAPPPSLPPSTWAVCDAVPVGCWRHCVSRRWWTCCGEFWWAAAHVIINGTNPRNGQQHAIWWWRLTDTATLLAAGNRHEPIQARTNRTTEIYSVMFGPNPGFLYSLTCCVMCYYLIVINKFLVIVSYLWWKTEGGKYRYEVPPAGQTGELMVLLKDSETQSPVGVLEYVFTAVMKCEYTRAPALIWRRILSDK